MVTLLNLLKEVERMPKDIRAANFGICTIVNNLMIYYGGISYEERKAVRRLMCQLMAAWPPSQGNWDFPVPTPDERLYGLIADRKQCEQQRRYCYVQMQKNKLMWSGPYGQSRQELFNFLIETLEREYSSERAVPILPAAP